jgi:predicted nucleotidyltransferase
MVNDEILAIKNSILKTVGKNCERIILFGSYAYGTPGKGSDYDVFVVLKDGTEKPILALQNIYGRLTQNPNYKAVDVLANYKSRFEARSKLPTRLITLKPLISVITVPKKNHGVTRRNTEESRMSLRRANPAVS